MSAAPRPGGPLPDAEGPLARALVHVEAAIAEIEGAGLDGFERAGTVVFALRRSRQRLLAGLKRLEAA